ncbi:hypothetical protein O6H91_14G039500 [Diphasiastrum complanatum]|nr:hypothetical protein O6H91_14G039500 [Diphasiastrum complanatum]
MKDPVSLASGVTYDRASIERWLEAGHNTCPATMQILSNKDLTPNHTLRRLIQAWDVANAQICSPKAAFDLGQMQLLLEDACMKGSTGLDRLKKLRAKAKESARNCRCILDSGGIPVLLSLLEASSSDRKIAPVPSSDIECCEAVLGILALVPADNVLKRIMASSKHLSSIIWLLRTGSMDARISAAVLLENLASERELKLVIGSTEGVFTGLVQLLKTNFNQMALKASLRALVALCLPRANRVRAVAAGVVHALLELLPDIASITAEHALAVMELLCRCAEGRAAFNQHALAIPVLARKICLSSDVASEYAVGILWAICKHSGSRSIHLKVVEAGVYAKLLFLLQMESSNKRKLAQFLKLLQDSLRYSPKACSFDKPNN